MRTMLWQGAMAAGLLVALGLAVQAQQGGGPLAGVKLPPYPTQHGERPGYPGCIKNAPQDQTPELELYPGSVEHYRTTEGKYTPTRSIFDRQSQLKNWTAPNLPCVAHPPSGVQSPAEAAGPHTALQAEEYAEPVYWVGRFAEVENTGVYELTGDVDVEIALPGGKMLKVTAKELAQGNAVVRIPAGR